MKVKNKPRHQTRKKGTTDKPRLKSGAFPRIEIKPATAHSPAIIMVPPELELKIEKSLDLGKLLRAARVNRP